jgi:hypothetical protein
METRLLMWEPRKLRVCLSKSPSHPVARQERKPNGRAENDAVLYPAQPYCVRWEVGGGRLDLQSGEKFDF